MTDARIQQPIVRIEVRLKVGQHLMSGTDDPVFLGIRGPGGREFRLRYAHGHDFQRGREDHFVFAGARDPATNVDHPEFNDPTEPALDAAAVTACYLRKGSEPLPNVRGFGEMDDRLEVEWVEVDLSIDAPPGTIRFERRGPLWLGLISGGHIEIPRVDPGE